MLWYSLDMLFYVSSAVAVVSLLLLLGMKETLPNKQAFHPRLLALKRSEILDADSILSLIHI